MGSERSGSIDDLQPLRIEEKNPVAPQEAPDKEEVKLPDLDVIDIEDENIS